MDLGAYTNLVNLDRPNDSGGYTPLNPATWHCAYLSQGSGVATFTGPSHADITTASRLHFRGRVYHVKSIRDDANDELILDCAEVFD